MHRVRLGKLAPLLLLLVFSLGCGTALELDTKTIKVKDDRYLTFKPWMHYSVKGSGRPLILIHDLLTDSYTWRKNVDELAEHFQVFTIDLPGFGKSVNPFDAYTLEFYSSMIGLFMQQMGMNEATLVGNGIGADVALDAYLRYPDVVKSVVVINGAGFDKPSTLMQQDEERIGIALHNSRKQADLERIQREVVEATLAHLYVNKSLVNSDMVKHYMSSLSQAGGRNAILGTLRFFDTDGLLARLIAAETDLMATRKMDRRGERTVLVIWGSEDAWYPPRTAEYFRARIPRSRVAIIKGAGHFPHEEEPETINGLLLDALLPRPVPGNQYTVAGFDASSLLEEGRKLKHRQKFKEAEAKFKAAIELNPYLGIAYYEIGDILFEQKMYAEAVEMLNESLRIYPHNAQVHYRLGTTYHNQATTMATKWAEQGMDASFIADNTATMIEKSIGHYEQAGKLDPKMPNPWFNLGRLYEQAGEYREVARVYGKLFDADPKNLRAANLYINALLRADLRPEAIEAIGRVEKIKSERKKASWPAWRAKLLMEEGSWAEAGEAWRRAADLDPSNPAYSGYSSLALANVGKLPEARAAVDLALAADGSNPEWHRISGTLALREQAWDKAEVAFKAVLRSLPDDLESLAGLSLAVARQGRGDEAAKGLDTALKRLPDQPVLLVARARVHALIAADPTKAARRRAEVQAAAELLRQAYDRGFDCFPLAQDPAFGAMKNDPVFKTFRKRLSTVAAPPPPPPPPPAKAPAKKPR